MAYESYDISDDFPGTANFTASGSNVEIALTNANPTYKAFYFLSSSAPTAADRMGGIPIVHGVKEAVTVNDGESLWICAPGLPPGQTQEDMVYRHY